MQTYPQYYPQMNNYGQQYNPQQPYMDRMAGLQQYQQALQQPQMAGTQMSLPNQQIGLNGKMVDTVEQITANDVPMDGSVAIFPKKDMSEIYLKSWTPNGTIATVVYRPVIEEPNDSPSVQENLKVGLSDEVTEVFMKKFDELANKIEELEKSITKPMTKATTSRTKKESEA
ncbi:hypothetical protein OCV51_10130 [Faecalicatena acetigenes]|uniref:Uncharacterized protein n=1 Tax=Faecalicatena acetigenes TaxID=2981790 RepID=A0ABT2TCK1_9FIRM|nr:hypothetical protein [Faecalicatena acetigenes]MCU6748004.1 hypothetical protein [Faecalicatena acetigenes]SCI21555.1 Uncharacterised protein [uncultured Clostridium sp.]